MMEDNTPKIRSLFQASAETSLSFVMHEALAQWDVTEILQIQATVKAATYLAIKRTSEIIPNRATAEIDYIDLQFLSKEDGWHIEVTVKGITREGLETHAILGASVAATTMADCLRLWDKGFSIGPTQLTTRKGGLTRFTDHLSLKLKAAIVVCSDTLARGEGQDKAGLAAAQKLHDWQVEVTHLEVIPDEAEAIEKAFHHHTAGSAPVDILLYTGGTGLSPRDITPETIRPLLDREIPGIMEAARQYGQERMPFAMLSRGIAGMAGKTLVITLPGSTNGTRETLDALFPQILHIFRVAKGSRHEPPTV
jgi:cyclic pyranopterin monophosphate synthase